MPALSTDVEQLPRSVQRLLQRLAGGSWVSGEELGRELGVSRAAVAKLVQRLREVAVPVEGSAGRGYRIPDARELLNPAQIEAVLAERSGAELEAVEVLLGVDSTNRYLVRRAPELEGARAVFAERQSAGKGRWGRSWLSPFGRNLYMSLYWPFSAVPDGFGGLSLAVGVRLAEALRAEGVAGLGLKWPNDLVTAHGKLGGILIELIGDPAGPCQAVVGVGINLELLPAERDELDQPAADLQSLLGEANVDRNRAAGLMLAATLDAVQEYAAEGFEPFAARWEALHVYAGRRVELHLPNRTVRGVALGVDRTGALRLETEGGVQSYASGDVRLRPADEIAD